MVETNSPRSGLSLINSGRPKESVYHWAQRADSTTDLKFSVSWIMVPDCDEISDNPVGEEDRVKGALSISSSPCEGTDKSIRQSKIDPNRRDFSRGYWAVKIGASCSESPAITTRPLGRRDRSTNAADPKDSCPASSITTQSTSKDRRLLKL